MIFLRASTRAFGPLSLQILARALFASQVPIAHDRLVEIYLALAAYKILLCAPLPHSAGLHIGSSGVNIDAA